MVQNHPFLKISYCLFGSPHTANRRTHNQCIFTSKTELDKQIMGSAMSQVNAFDTLIDENIGNKAEAVTLFTDDLKAVNLQEK